MGSTEFNSIVGIIGGIIGIIGIIITIISFIRSKSYTTGKYIKNIIKQNDVSIEKIIYIENGGQYIAPIINTEVPFPKKDTVCDDTKIQKALSRENSIQIYTNKLGMYCFRILSLYREILFCSSEYDSLEKCKEAINHFIEQYKGNNHS